MTIPEAIVERTYGLQVDENGNKIKQKDVNRSPNVTERLEDFVRTHNESMSDASAERLIWFSDNLSNRQRQKRAKNIIRAKLSKHLRFEWLNGSITFNTCQIEHGRESEVCIEEINAEPVMAVYAQAERSWAVRRMMEDMFANRRRTYLKKMKLEDGNDSAEERSGQQESGKVANMDVEHAPLQQTVSMTEEDAAVAATKTFNELQNLNEEQILSSVLQTCDEAVDDKFDGCQENVSDIEEQIALLKSKKKRLQRQISHGKDQLDQQSEPVGRNVRSKSSTKGVKKSRKTGKKSKNAHKARKN